MTLAEAVGDFPGSLTEKKRLNDWYRDYGFNTEEEFDRFWQQYGSKISLRWRQAPLKSFSTYEEYQKFTQQAADLINVKWTLYRGLVGGPVFSRDDPNYAYLDPVKAYQPGIQVKTSDGRIWNFWLPEQSGEGNTAVNGKIIFMKWQGIKPQRAFYNMLRLISSPLVIWIGVYPWETKYAYPPEQFETFVQWITSGRIPISLTALPGVPPTEQPSTTPPPVSAPPVTTPPTPPSAGGPGATPSAKSILPYVAIGAGALVLLVLLMRK
jgi:hypothetical protein